MKNHIRKTVSLPDKTWRAISEYRHDNRMATEAEAIREIVAKALKVKK